MSWCPVPSYHCVHKKIPTQSSPCLSFFLTKMMPPCIYLFCQGWVWIRGKTLVDPGLGPRLSNEVMCDKLSRRRPTKSWMIWKQGEFNEEVKPGFVCLAALPFDWYEIRYIIKHKEKFQVKNGIDLKLLSGIYILVHTKQEKKKKKLGVGISSFYGWILLNGSWAGKMKLKSQKFILKIGQYFCLVKLYHANGIPVIPIRFMISAWIFLQISILKSLLK